MNKKICPFLDKLSAYSEGDLSTTEMEKVDLHLDQCEECREYLEEMSSLVEDLKTLPSVSVSDEFTGKVMAQVKREKIGSARQEGRSYIIGIILAFVIYGLHSLLSHKGYQSAAVLTGLFGAITAFLSEPSQAEAVAIIVTGVWGIISGAAPFIIANLLIITFLACILRNKRIPVNVEAI